MPLNEKSKLSPRLQAVATLVPECRRLLDIGTDHAGLPIELVRRGRCQQALAIDIRPGPLDMALRNINAAGLTDRIKVWQADGLTGLELDPVDVLAIAGMGGYEMMQILGSEPRRCQAIILQPMKSLPELRIWLGEQGYTLEDEVLVLEQHHTYVILRCRYTGVRTAYTPLQALVGPVLLVSQPPALAVYLTRLLARLKKQSRGQPDLIEVIEAIQKLEA